jgi:TonB-linked SusC/RagA family outer membrane protein
MKKFTLLLFLFFATIVVAEAQTVVLRAKLLDSKTKEGVVGATVKEVKGKKFAVTGSDGSFTLNLSPNITQLQISSVGYSSTIINVSDFKDGEVLINQSPQELGGVVVTALGIKREKKALGYAVQEIKAEDLVKGRTQNVVNALQGKVAGINITQGSNGPGSSSQIVIRGLKFLGASGGGSGVLYVIDGIPMDNTIRSTVAEFNGADGGDGIQNISPDDIENISVLKGPNAAALYGSRAINGVIMVTTKKGGIKKGLGVNYSFDYNNEKALLLPDIQTTFGQGGLGVYSPSSDQSWGPKITGQALTATGWNNNNFNMTGRNLAKDILQTGSNMNHSIAVTSGGEKSSAYFSLNYNKQKGIVPENELTRYIANVRLNSSLSSKLSLESRFTYSNQTVDNRPNGGEDAANPYSSALRMPVGIPYSELEAFEKTVFNKPAVNFYLPNSGVLNNPYWFINKYKRKEIRNRLIGLLGTTYAITPELGVTVRSGFDFYNDLIDNKISAGSPTAYTNGAAGGNYSTFYRNFFTINTDVLITYKKKFKSVGVEATLGANNRFDRQDETTTNANGLSLVDVFSFGNAVAGPTASNNFFRRKVNSAYGMIQGSFKDWLFADFTLRNDWYSTLNSGNNSLLYPSVNLSAIVSDLWKKKPDFINFMKIRGSYGVAGRDGAPFETDYYLTAANGGVGVVLTNPNVLPNPTLRPEQSRSLEFGTDLRFWNNRINIDFTWYKGNTINQIIQAAVQPSTGFGANLINAGNIENKGIELTLGVVAIKAKAFNYTTTFNFARNRSTVIEIGAGITNFGFAANRAATAGAKIGERLGNLNVIGYQRAADGQILIGTDGLPLLTPSRNVVAGNVFPDWTGGWNNEFSYKGFALNLLFDIRQGGVIVSHTEGYLAGLGLAKATEANRDNGFVVDGVKADGSKNTTVVTPQAYFSKIGARGGITGEAFTYDASNMRLRQAALSYNLPASVIKKLPIRSASVSIYGRNLFFVYKKSPMDPDVSLNGGTGASGYGVDFYSLPTTRSMGINLKVGF